jgi:hypothetical protein
MTGRRSNAALVGTLGLVVTGLLFADPTLLVAAAIPLAYVLFESLSAVPAEVSLSAHRSFEPATPTPGERVTVTLTVEHEGTRVVPDLRIVDGVPETVAVADGPARASVPLVPGATTTVEYTVVARQGDHEFTDPEGRLRSLAAAGHVTRSIAVEGETTLTCATVTRERPVRPAQAATAGGGMEFHSTRAYRRGDPMRRIDWHHVAKTGDFVTVQYREKRQRRVVVVVDARPVGRVRPDPGYPTATALCADSAERVAAAVEGASTHTSVAAVGLDRAAVEHIDGVALDRPESAADDPADGFAWLDSADSRLSPLLDSIRRLDADSPSGRTVGLRSNGRPPVLAGTRADSQTVEGATADGGQTSNDAALKDDVTARLLARVPADARVVVCTPLLDDWPVALGRALARERSLVVVSPDVLTSETPGTRIARIERRLRLRALDAVGETVDWNPETDHTLLGGQR